MKRDELLKGGLNALLGGSQNQTQGEAAPEPPTAPTDGAEASQEIVEGTPEEEDELIATITDRELKEALRKKRLEKRGRPRKSAAYRSREAELYTRTTWIMRRDLLAKLKEISFRETLTLKEILEQIVSEAVAVYEKKHGELKPRDHRGDPSSLFTK